MNKKTCEHLFLVTMTLDLQDGYYGDVEKKEDAWIDVHGPIMLCVEHEVIGVGGAIKRANDILEAKKSEEKKKEKL